MVTIKNAKILHLLPFLPQVLPYLQAPRKSDGNSKAASSVFGGHPCVIAGSWGFNHFTP